MKYTNLIIFSSVGHLSYPKQGETPLEGQDEEFGDDQSINHDKKHNNPFVRYVYIWRFLQINALVYVNIYRELTTLHQA